MYMKLFSFDTYEFTLQFNFTGSSQNEVFVHYLCVLERIIFNEDSMNRENTRLPTANSGFLCLLHYILTVSIFQFSILWDLRITSLFS